VPLASSKALMAPAATMSAGAGTLLDLSSDRIVRFRVMIQINAWGASMAMGAIEASEPHTHISIR